jgi:hypothetical protein
MLTWWTSPAQFIYWTNLATHYDHCRALFLSPRSPRKTETDGDTRRVCADLYPFKLQRFRRQVPHPGLHISQQSVVAFTLPMRDRQDMTRPARRDQKSQRRHHDCDAGQTQGSVSRMTTLQITEPCCYWSWFDLSFPCVPVLHFLKYPREEFHPMYKVSSQLPIFIRLRSDLCVFCTKVVLRCYAINGSAECRLQ